MSLFRYTQRPLIMFKQEIVFQKHLSINKAFPSLPQLGHLQMTKLKIPVGDTRPILYITPQLIMRYGSLAKQIPWTSVIPYVSSPTLTLFDQLKVFDGEVKQWCRDGDKVPYELLGNDVNSLLLTYLLPHAEESVKYQRLSNAFPINTFAYNLLHDHLESLLYLLRNHPHNHIYFPEAPDTLKVKFEGETNILLYGTSSTLKDWKIKLLKESETVRQQPGAKHSLSRESRKAWKLVLDTNIWREPSSGRFKFSTLVANDIVRRSRNNNLMITFTEAIFRELLSQDEGSFMNWWRRNTSSVNFQCNVPASDQIPIPVISSQYITSTNLAGDNRILYELVQGDPKSAHLVSNDASIRIRARTLEDHDGESFASVLSASEAKATIMTNAEP